MTKISNRKTLNLTQSSILRERFRCSCRRTFLNSMIASLRNDDSTGYDNATNNNLIGWIKKNNRAARAARRFPEIFIFEVLTSTRTVAINLSFFTFTWKPFVPSAPRLFYTTWSTWNNRETLNLTQSSILKWRFRRRSRRSFLNSRVGSFPGGGGVLPYLG